MTSQPKIIELYKQGKYDELARTNLSGKLDDDGNTIFHIIADNLDQNALERLFSRASIQVKNHINIINNKGESPIHRALDAIKNKSYPNDNIITYMVDVLEADPTIPDSQNRIIVPAVEEKATDSLMSPTSSIHNKIMNLNDTVIKNIMELKKINSSNIKDIMNSSQSNSLNGLRDLFGKKSDTIDRSANKNSDTINDFANKKSSISTYMGNDESNKIQFIRSLIKLYSPHSKNHNNNDDNEMHGGKYSSTRYINSKFSLSDLSDMSDMDEFNLGNTQHMLNRMGRQDRPKMDQQVFDENNRIYKEVIQKIVDDLKVSRDIAEIVATYLKVQVKKEHNLQDSDPDSDRKKIDKVKEIVDSGKELSKKYKEMKDTELFEEIKKKREQRRQQREERRSKENNGSSDGKSNDGKSRDNKSKESKDETSKKKQGKKSNDEQTRIAHAKKKLAPTGYIKSDEMIFSSEY